MDTKDFNDFALNKSLLKALSEQGYQKPTDIQRAAIPVLLTGNDLFASAQTGTGKTAAFSLPILQILGERRVKRPEDKAIRALVLTPTRELALQIDEARLGSDQGPPQTSRHTGGHPRTASGPARPRASPPQ
jgi:superfamily II DNA/RNA helicase